MDSRLSGLQWDPKENATKAAVAPLIRNARPALTSEPKYLNILDRSSNRIHALIAGINTRWEALSFEREYDTNASTGLSKSRQHPITHAAYNKTRRERDPSEDETFEST